MRKLYLLQFKAKQNQGQHQRKKIPESLGILIRQVYQLTCSGVVINLVSWSNDNSCSHRFATTATLDSMDHSMQ